MKKLGCAKCGGQKMAKGGSTRLAAAGIPFATGAGQTDGKNMMMKKGGMVKNAKLAALAAPKNKITRADIITGAKKKALSKKQLGGPATSNNPNPTKTFENLAGFIGGGLATAIAARKQNQPMSEKKKERVLARQQKRATRKKN
jgi:hypothetical protein